MTFLGGSPTGRLAVLLLLLWKGGVTSQNAEAVDARTASVPAGHPGLGLGEYCCGLSHNNPCSVAGSGCDKCICTCKADHTYDNSSKECRFRRKKLPLESCANASECIIGLDCNESTCVCPSSCKFVPEKMLCDCGPRDVPWAPIVLGILLGLGIVVCWYKAIKKSIQCYTEKKAHSRQMDSSQSGISTLGSLYGLDSVVYQYPLETDAHPPTKNHAHEQPPLGFRSSEPRYLELQPLDLARSRSVPSSPSRLHPSELPPPYSSLPPFPPPPSKTQPSSSRPPPDYAQLSFSFTGGATEDHPPPQPSVGPQSTRPPQSARF